jgi:hypothetical protein
LVNIPGATAASYTIPPATLADSPTLFRCVVTNAAGNATSACELLLVTNADNTQRAGATQPSAGQ